MLRKLLLLFFVVGAISMLVMSFHFFKFEVSGILKLKGAELLDGSWFRYFFKAHIFFGIIAITVGPFQFIKRIKSKLPKIHTTLGYFYLTSIILAGITGLVIAQYAMGGWISSFGFTLLAICWPVSTVLAVRSILKGDIEGHKKWMYLSYGLTFAAITQRTMLLIPLLTEVPFILVYRSSAWIPWLLNSAIAYWLCQKSIPKNEVANERK